MELNEVKTLWQAYDYRLEKSLKLNVHCLALIQGHKVKSQLQPLIWHRVVELTFHAIAIVLLTGFLINNFMDWRYALSAIALLTFYAIAFSNCIRQIIIIKRMDYSDDIITIQSSLVLLRTHMLSIGRLAVLFIPTFLAFPMVVSKAIADLGLTGLSFLDVRTGYHGDWWSVQLICSVILVPLCVWFYIHVTYKNIHKKWVKDTVEKFSSKRVSRSFEFINELESLKQDVHNN